MNKTMLSILLLSVIALTGCSTNNITGDVVTKEISELSIHNSADDCWVAYNDKYYDITQMIAAGKHKPLDDLCGTDITEVFNSGPHVGYSEQKLGKYLVE